MGGSLIVCGLAFMELTVANAISIQRKGYSVSVTGNKQVTIRKEQ